MSNATDARRAVQDLIEEHEALVREDMINLTKLRMIRDKAIEAATEGLAPEVRAIREQDLINFIIKLAV
ncbi:hypothetical protein DRQ53_08575 [bacterium]|nr:MAG: hypothetical protein DRQ53_08575 [bacterium]